MPAGRRDEAGTIQSCQSVNVGEIVGAVQLAISGNLPFTPILEAILTHPRLRSLRTREN